MDIWGKRRWNEAMSFCFAGERQLPQRRDYFYPLFASFLNRSWTVFNSSQYLDTNESPRRPLNPGSIFSKCIALVVWAAFDFIMDTTRYNPTSSALQSQKIILKSKSRVLVLLFLRRLKMVFCQTQHYGHAAWHCYTRLRLRNLLYRLSRK